MRTGETVLPGVVAGAHRTAPVRGRHATPRVSVGMPVRNGARYLDRTLRSILAQDFTDFELNIADNASTDATEAICRWYAARDPRVRYVRSDRNLGAAANHNRVVGMARGEYFKLASHDDICHRSLLRRCVEALDRAPADVVLVYPRAIFIDARGGYLAPDTDVLATASALPVRRLTHLVSHVNMVNALFGVIRTDALRRTRLLDSFVGADYVLLGELALLGNLEEIDDVLFYRRLHPEMSRKANPGVRQALAWFNPEATLRDQLLPPGARLVVEYVRSALRLPIPRWQAAASVVSVPLVYGSRRARVRLGRARARLSVARHHR